MYHENLIVMIFIQNRRVEVYIRREHNFFIVDLIVFNQVMLARILAMRKIDHFIHFVNQNR